AGAGRRARRPHSLPVAGADAGVRLHRRGGPGLGAGRGAVEEAGDVSEERRQGRSSGGTVSGAQLAQRARDQLAEITGYQAEGITSLERAEDGTWFVTVDLLELERVPETDDLLGSYEAQVDEDGELLG